MDNKENLVDGLKDELKDIKSNKKEVGIYGLVMSCVMEYLNHVFVVFVSSQQVTIKEQLTDKNGKKYEDIIYNKEANENSMFDVNKAINSIPDYIVYYVEHTY